MLLPTNAAPKPGPSKRQDLGWKLLDRVGSEAVSTTRTASCPAGGGRFVAVVAQGAGRHPVHERLERGDLRDAEVVAREQPDRRVTPQRLLEAGAEAVEAALLHEGGDDGDVGGPGEEREDVPGEGVVGAGRERAGLSEVVPLAGDHVPDAAARVVHVAAVARDDVHVQMHDRLARGLPRVEADVVAVGPGRELAVELGFDLVDGVEQRALLLSGGVEPGGDVPLGHDEGVAGGDGVAVAEREHELAGPGAVLGRERAERAALVAGGRHRGRG